MKILAVDTSANVATVAITENDRVVGEYFINHGKTHSQKLMPMIKELMKSLDVNCADIDLFAASNGPGSFTGLRIGVTSIKAMAYVAQKPVIGVPTLDALAYNIPANESLICPIMDARNNQVYTAIYQWEQDKMVRVSEYMGIPIEALLKLIQSKNSKTTFLGDGVTLHRNLLKESLEEQCVFAMENSMLQRASSVAKAASIMIAEGKVENYFEMVPFYLRKSQAEREYDKKRLLVDR